jgi:DEP domain-containing protein 5
MSAIIKTNYTKFTFFSKSAQIYIMIEMSRETYEFDQDGFLYVEKIQYFLRNFLERCKNDSACHEIVFVLYGRLYYPQIKSREELLEQTSCFGS